MKKKIFLFAVAVGLLTACDPIKDEASMDIDNITAEQLMEGATFSQYNQVKDADGNISYVEAADGNYIKYSLPHVSAVQIFYLKPDGSEFILSKGASAGMFAYVPGRGSDPNPTVYFRYVNQDGKEIVAQKEFTLQVAQDLSPEMKLLCSNDGKKVWKWNTNAPDGRYWGNLGSDGTNGLGVDIALKGGSWWGVTQDEELLTQLNHTDDGKAHGDESLDATMVITEDGLITCYDKDGKQIRQGKFEVLEYDPTYSQTPANVGILKTDPGTILFPYEINSNGRMPETFYIAYLTPARLTLYYPDGGEFSGWSEGTFWQFESTSDVVGCLTDNSEATWEWDNDNGQCWGNAGYGSFVYAKEGSINGGQWWGITSADLAEEISKYGYPDNDGEGATMTLSSDGLIKKSSGGNGAFEVDITNTSDLGGYNEGKTLGRFKTTGSGIMFAQRINPGDHPDLPAQISEFDIAYISDNNFVLIAPSFYLSSGGQSWQEGTFWRFKKVK